MVLLRKIISFPFGALAYLISIISIGLLMMAAGLAFVANKIAGREMGWLDWDES